MTTSSPDAYAQPQAPVVVAGTHSRIVAAVLAFFLGTLGIHDFYLGYKSRGITKLMLTVVGTVLYAFRNSTDSVVYLIAFAGSWMIAVVGIWSFVNFVQILLRKGKYTKVDASGTPLQ